MPVTYSITRCDCLSSFQEENPNKGHLLSGGRRSCREQMSQQVDGSALRSSRPGGRRGDSQGVQQPERQLQQRLRGRAVDQPERQNQSLLLSQRFHTACEIQQRSST